MSELIAEARVLIRPDTTRFKAELEAEINAQIKSAKIAPVVVPVTATTAATGAATAATAAAEKQAAAGARAATVSARRSEALLAEAAAAKAAATSQEQLARATEILSVAERRAEAITTEIGVAQARYAASIRATTTTFEAYQAALATTDFELRKQARDAFIAAKANEALALSNLNAARAEQEATAATTARAASFAQARKGALSAAAAQAGLRGATLAAGGAFIAGAAGVIAFGKAVKSFADLQQNLNVFQVTAGATADEMARVSDEARALGADLTLPGVTANDAAQALGELSKAGLSVQDSMDGVRGTLQLATAAGIDNSEATTLVASALNAFSLAGTDASRVADLLAASSKESQGSISDVGLALQQSAAAAAQAGISVQDTIALLTELARAGLRGSDAGTSLRVALIRLIAPTKQAKEALAGLGVSIRDAQGNVRPEAFAEIVDQLSKLGNAQRDATLALIFGQDAFRAAAILGKQGAAGLNEMRQATQEQGAAAELAAAKNKGLSGSFENLGNQLSTTGNIIGETVAPAIEEFTNFLAEGFANINSGLKFLDRLQHGNKDVATSAQEVSKAYEEQIEKVGRFTRLLAERGNKASKDFREETENLTQALEDQAPAALKAAGAIETYRAGLQATAAAAEGLINRLDESFDRFSRPLPTPTLPGPKPIGPSARASRAEELAQASGDLGTVLQLQRERLARDKKALAESHGNVAQRTKIFNQITQDEVDIANTQRQIMTQAAQKITAARTAADQAAIDAISARDTGLEQAVQRAQEADRPFALVKALQALLAQRKKDIQTAQATISDEKTLQSTLRQLRAARFQTAQDLISAQKAQQDAIAESFQKRLTFAELKAELTGNDTVLVNAINAYIKYLRTVALPAAKKARQGVIDVKTEIERLLVQRKELANTVAGESPDVFAARLFQQAADQFRRFGSNISTSSAGLLSPQAARGQFAANLLGPTGQADAVAVRQRDNQLAETKKQTALLQVIARGPRREIKGVTVPKATQETVANIAANVLRGL